MCPFTDSISEKKSKTQIDNAENIDVVIPKYSLIDYSVISKHLEVYDGIIGIKQR